MRTRIISLCLFAACNTPEKAPPPTPTSEATSPAPITAATKDPRTPADFAKEWAEIYALSNEEQRRIRALTMIERWEGNIYEWDAYVLASLCQHESRCAVNIVERNQLPSPDSLGGFFPVLQLSKDSLADLREGCKGKTGCVLRFEGTLTALRTDPEFPLGMTFSDVKVVRTRDANPGELWFKDKPSFALPSDYKPTSLQLPNPKEAPLPPLKVKVHEPVF